MAAVIAFVADDGSPVAWVFGPGKFSAVRTIEGTWRSPAPESKAGDFADGYERLPEAEANALSNEARMAAIVRPGGPA